MEGIIGLGFSGSLGMEENELEEGEACSDGQEDASCIDPDVSLSYIDEKLQHVLGHFQKDFEGRVSAENLGAKFGGYGSFLPTFQRSPSILSQPRSPPSITDHGSASKSAYNLPVEATRRKTPNLPIDTTSFISRDKISATDDSRKNDKCESTLNARESDSPRNLSNKMANDGDQKTQNVHIKACPGNILARNNTAIYSGLGLGIPPSSSPEDSPTGSGGLSPKYQVTFVESPNTILQNMTCFPVPGGFLLSPLRGIALDLKEKVMPFIPKSKTSTLHKNASEPCAGFSKLTLLSLDIKGDIAKKMRTDEKKGGPADLNSLNCTDGINKIVDRDVTQAAQELVSDAPNASPLVGLRGTEGQAVHLVEESTKGSSRMVDHTKRMKNDPVKVQATTPKFVMDKTELECNIGNIGTQAKCNLNLKASKIEKTMEGVNMYRNPLQDMHGENEKDEINYNGFDGDSDEHKERIDQCIAPPDHVQQVSSYGRISGEREREKVIAVKDQLFKDKRKHQGSQIQTELSTSVLKNNLGVQSSEAVNVKKISSCSRTNQSEKKLKVKSHKKLSGHTAEKSHGNVPDRTLVNKNVLEDLPHKAKLKAVKPEIKKEPITFGEASKERAGSRMIDNHQLSKAFVKPVPVPSANNVVTTEAAAVAPAPAVIEEEWVCCDSCQKWRLLPYGTNPADLPKSWKCILLSWLPGMNSCKISEEETEAALRALYMIPAAETGNSDGHHDVVASSINTGSALQRLENNAEPANKSMKRKYGPQDTANIPNQLNPVDLTVEKQKSRHKEKHNNTGCYSAGGDLRAKSAKHSNLKSDRMLDQNDNRESKRFKKENFHKPAKKCDSGVDVVGKAVSNISNVLPSKALAKNPWTYGDVSLGNENCDSRANLSASKKRPNEEDFLLSNEENRKQLTNSNAWKSDSPDFSAKKRKLREGQGSYQENPTSHQAMGSNDFLKRNMDYAQAPPAATSCSSKVSSSQRAKANFHEAKGSPVESVSSSPSRIDHDEKLYDKRNLLIKDEAVNVTTSILGSLERFSDSEADEGKSHWVKERKECHRQVKSRTSSPLGRASNYHHKETEQLSGARVQVDLDLKKGFHGDSPPAMNGDKKLLSSSVNLPDQRRFADGNSDKMRTEDLHKLNNNQLIDGWKNSSSQCKEKHKSRKFDVAKGNVKIYGALVDNMGSQLLKNGDRYREENCNYHFKHCSYSGELKAEDPNIQEKVSSVHRRDNQSTFGMQKSSDADDHCLRPNQNHNFDIKAAVSDAKHDKFNVHAGSKQVSSLQDEKSLIHSLVDQNDRAEFARGKGESQLAGDKETQKQGTQVVSNDVNFSALRVAKQLRKPDIPNGVQQNNLRQATPNGPDSSSPVRKDSSTAYTVFKEARDLKHTANRLKNEGLHLESTSLYFEAALKFLHGATLSEPPGFDNAKQGDATQSITMYSETANLCKFCAQEYERLKELAAAALAYKCVEVALLKAAFYKCAGAIKDRQELQTAVKMVPSGESPSSSASDLDHLNNQGTMTKAATSKGVNSPLIAGHHVIAARNYPHLMRMLAYTNDLNCAFEATRKSHIAIASASVSLEKYGVDAIASVRKVLEFNFHNVRDLLQLVRLSMESIIP